jgi:hypothetical protein
MTPFDDAMARAARGLDWSYPCLIWAADYVMAATGNDPAAGWRHLLWDEPTARASLGRLAARGEGNTAVERALDFIARRDGWRETDGPQQGAVMVGVYDDGETGYPAIFDGWRGWLVTFTGAATILREPPKRMWEIDRHPPGTRPGVQQTVRSNY